MRNFLLLILLFPTLVFGQTYIQGPALIEGVTVIASAAGTTTLTKDSQTTQIVTGATTQTIKLPDATTIPIGRKFFIENQSSGIVTVNDSTSTLVLAIASNQQTAIILSAHASAAGTWNASKYKINVGDNTNSITGVMLFGNGGTGFSSYTDGQLLIGNTSTGGLSRSTLTAGSNITITNGNGTISIAASGGGSGTVTSVDLTMPGIFSVSGNPVTTSGTLAVVASGTSGGVPYFSSSSTLASTAGGTTTQVLHGNAAGALSFSAVALGADVSGTLPVGNGGTGQTSYTDGQLLIGNTSGNTLAKSTLTAGNGIGILNGNGSITLLRVPPVAQSFTGSGTYNLPYTFLITSGSATTGATYTNNSVTFTVLNTVASATQVVMTGSGAPATSGTLTKASGTGDATLTFSQALTPQYLRVRMTGAGGGGSGSGTANGSATAAGANSTFGSSLLTANGGSGAGLASAYSGGAGGAFTVNSPAIDVGSRTGNRGAAGGSGATTGDIVIGGNGGDSCFATGGRGSNTGTIAAGTGGGGAGGGTGGVAASIAGNGGGSSSCVDAIIPTPSATYSYTVGTAGSNAGGLGTSGSAGGNGGDGKLIVEAEF